MEVEPGELAAFSLESDSGKIQFVARIITAGILIYLLQVAYVPPSCPTSWRASDRMRCGVAVLRLRLGQGAADRPVPHAEWGVPRARSSYELPDLTGRRDWSCATPGTGETALPCPGR